MQVDQVIASYFEGIYKRPDHMQQYLEDRQAQNEEMADEEIDTTATFSIDDIRQATQQTNFNKGLGPVCFDGNILSKNEQLGAKVM